MLESSVAHLREARLVEPLPRAATRRHHGSGESWGGGWDAGPPTHFSRSPGGGEGWARACGVSFPSGLPGLWESAALRSLASVPGCGQLGRLWSTPGSGAGGEGGPSASCTSTMHSGAGRPGPSPVQVPLPHTLRAPHTGGFPGSRHDSCRPDLPPEATASLCTWVPRARGRSQPCPEEGPLPPHGAHAGTLAHAGECHRDSDPPGWASLKPADWVPVTDSGGCFRDNLFIRPLGSRRLSRSTAGGPDRAPLVTGGGVGGGFLWARGGGSHHGGRSGAGLGHPGLTCTGPSSGAGPSPATEVQLV